MSAARFASGCAGLGLVRFRLGYRYIFFSELPCSNVVARGRRIRQALRTQVVILADRLDYTKGILERLLGCMERFLENIWFGTNSNT